MNKILRYITIGLFLVLTISCEEDININGNHQAILNVHFMKDSTQAYWMLLKPIANDAIIASLHQSLDITDTIWANRKLENARIDIYSDNELVTSIEPDNELYTSQAWTPVEGKTYWVYGYADGYEVLSGECQMPYTIPINSVEYKYNLVDDEFNFYDELEVYVNISDPANQKNYYFIQVFKIDQYGKSVMKIQTLDPFIEESNLFTDEFFNGKTHNIHFKKHPYQGNLIDAKVVIELWSISESYYNIYKAMYQYHYVLHNDIYAEPVQIYSNVNNGLGVISASTVCRDTIILSTENQKGICKNLNP